MKWKSVVAIGAALGLIVLGALLPGLVAARQQRLSEGEVLFSQVGYVELDFSSDDISFSEILSIYGESKDPVEVPSELASQKKEKVKSIASATAEKYRDAGILLSDPGKDELLQCQTVLYYGRENQSNIYWLLRYGDREGAHMLTLVVDDSTGAVCAAEYTDQESEYDPEQMEQVLEDFCGLYLQGLGDLFLGYSAEALVQNAKQPQDKSYLATELVWTDPLYGDRRITFFVNRSGFYTYFGR